MTPLNESTSPDKAGVREAMKARARERALPLVIEGTDQVRQLRSTELIQAFYSHEIAAHEAFLPSPQPAPVGEGTPRTDAAREAFGIDNVAEAWQLARTLERELGEAKKELADEKAAILSTLKTASREQDTLRAALSAEKDRVRTWQNSNHANAAALAAAQSELGEVAAYASEWMGIAQRRADELVDLRHQLEEARKERDVDLSSTESKAAAWSMVAALIPDKPGTNRSYAEVVCDEITSLRRDKELLRDALKAYVRTDELTNAIEDQGKAALRATRLASARTPRKEGEA